jgi:hypothetical protein
MHQARTQDAPGEGSDGTTPVRPEGEGAADALIEELNECIVAALAAPRSADPAQRDPVLIAVTNGLLAAKVAGVSTKAVERGALLGVINASAGAGNRMVRHVAETSSALVRASARLGGDVGAAARSAIESAAAAAVGSDLDVESAASAAAEGATQGAAQLGPLALDRVRQICRGTIRRLVRT